MTYVMDDFHSGLMPEEIDEAKQELETETFKEELQILEAQEETQTKFIFHVGVKSKDGYFEEDRVIRALDRREAERILEKELDAYECEYNYKLN